MKFGHDPNRRGVIERFKERGMCLELKSPLMKVKEESGKNWLKTQHSKN